MWHNLTSLTVTPNCNIKNSIIPSLPLLFAMARGPRSYLKKRNKSFEEVKIYCDSNKMRIIAEPLPIHYQRNGEHTASDHKFQILRVAKFKKKIICIKYEKFLKGFGCSFIICLSHSMSKLPPREMVLSPFFFLTTHSCILHCGDPSVETSTVVKTIHE